MHEYHNALKPYESTPLSSHPLPYLFFNIVIIVPQFFFNEPLKDSNGSNGNGNGNGNARRLGCTLLKSSVGTSQTVAAETSLGDPKPKMGKYSC